MCQFMYMLFLKKLAVFIAISGGSPVTRKRRICWSRSFYMKGFTECGSEDLSCCSTGFSHWWLGSEKC